MLSWLNMPLVCFILHEVQWRMEKIACMQRHERAHAIQVLHSGDLICEGVIKQQAEPAKAEEPKKEEPAAQEPSPAAAPAQPVPTAGVTANVAVISVSHLHLPSAKPIETRLQRH